MSYECVFSFTLIVHDRKKAGQQKGEKRKPPTLGGCKEFKLFGVDEGHCIVYFGIVNLTSQQTADELKSAPFLEQECSTFSAREGRSLRR